MNFKKGDKVKFLNDVGQGVIIRFKDKNIAVVLNDDGFEVPVLMSELLIVEGAYSFSDNQNSSSHDQSKTSTNQTPSVEEPDNLEEDGFNTDQKAQIYFSMVPSNQKDVVNSDLEVYLINDSNYRLMYSVSRTENDFQSLFAYGNLEDNTKVILGKIKRDELAGFEELHFQFIFFRKGNFYLIKPFHKKWNVKPSRFYKQSTFTENEFFHQKAFIYDLSSDEINMSNFISDADIEKAKKEKEQGSSVNQPKRKENNSTENIEEVDLHIQELINDHSKLSNGEILEIQMSRFITSLDGGIISGSRRMIFIHGVGNGRLKHEIYKTLDKKYPKLKYQDASFREYGYGATMVIIK